MIIPSRGPAERLERLLDSLAAGTVRSEVLVVDNGSTGAEVSACCASYDFATPIALERNAGFSVAVNMAAARASGEALVLLNDDCRCDPSFVENIVATLDPGSSVVMAAGVLRSPRRPDLIDTAGLQFDRTLLVEDYLSGRPMSVLERPVPDPVGPSGAAAAFDRAAFLDCGGFDERLFAYWEDVDLALRLFVAGGRCRLATDAVGTHEHSATLGSGSAAKNRLTGFGRGYVLRKWGVLTPGRLAPVAARELLVVAGQAVVDRNLAGVGGRLAGWRAASPTERYPDIPVTGGSPATTMIRRWRRRRVDSAG